MPYRCGTCKKYFSLRTGSLMKHSKLSLRIWAIAVYPMLDLPKGVSSIQLAKLLGITQKSAAFLRHRFRKAFATPEDPLHGPVEADEAYLDGKEKNKHRDRKLNASRGAVGKTPVMGLKDRETNTIVAEPVRSVHRAPAEKMIGDSVSPEAQVYTDSSRIYDGLDHRKSVNHSRGEYVRGEVHTNGIESFRAPLKRGYHGTFHPMSRKHLHRYVNEFTGRYSSRGKSLLDCMAELVSSMVGQGLTYKDLVAWSRVPNPGTGWPHCGRSDSSWLRPSRPRGRPPTLRPGRATARTEARETGPDCPSEGNLASARTASQGARILTRSSNLRSSPLN